MSYIYGSLPIGSVIPYAGTELPKSFLWCDGAKYKIGSYKELFKVINHLYDNQPTLIIDNNTFNDINVLDGVFAVPDLRGRIPIGAGVGKVYPSKKRMMDDNANGIDLTPIIQGQYDGENNHSLLANEVADHVHYFKDWAFAESNGNVSLNAFGLAQERSAGSPSGVDYDNLPFDAPSRVNATLKVGASYNPAAENKSVQPLGSPHNNMQPYCGLNFIIRAI